jgi:hypothetical protein
MVFRLGESQVFEDFEPALAVVPAHFIALEFRELGAPLDKPGYKRFA